MSASSELVADAIARSVAASGARYVFGHPGGEVVVLIDALNRAGVRFVLTHHETSAAMMAAGSGEYSGRPGICISTLGPGATNMVSGVASAFLERAPVLALTASSPPGGVPGITHQCVDLVALYAAVTKASMLVAPTEVGSVVDGALALAVAPRQGPVHLSVPATVASSPHSAGVPLLRTAAVRSGTPLPPGLDRAKEMLDRARRPAIIAGLGAIKTDAHQQLCQLAASIQAPVALLPKAKGLVPNDHPWFAGVLEMAGEELVVELLNSADLILNVGVDAVEFIKPWRFEAPVIHLDTLPNDSHHYPCDVSLTGSIPDILAALTAGSTCRSSWDAAQISGHRQALDSYVSGDPAALGPAQVVKILSHELVADTIATCDVGAHKLLVGQVWPTDRPRRFFVANGLSSMGYALPVAIAIKLAEPLIPVVAFIGDGGLAMYLGELETCVRLKIDMTLVVFADSSLELIRRSQLTRSVATVGTSFGNPDFTALGKAFGFPVHRMSKPAEVREAAAKIRNSRGLQMLVAEIDGDDYRL